MIFNANQRDTLMESNGEYVNFPDIVNSMNKKNDNYLFKNLNDNNFPVVTEINLDLYSNIPSSLKLEIKSIT